MNVLKKAAKTVKNRGSVYGDPSETYDRAYRIWSILRWDGCTPSENGLLFMLAVKLARMSVSPSHEDNLVDACGYLALLAKIRGSDNETED